MCFKVRVKCINTVFKFTRLYVIFILLLNQLFTSLQGFKLFLFYYLINY